MSSAQRGALPVRFRILAILFLLSFVNYLLRNNLSVALPSIQAEFKFSAEDLGWILAGFNFAYTIFQIPGGVFGERLGPRRCLAFLCAAWGALTALTGFVPSVMVSSATGAMLGLMAVRFLMGATNAPFYPVCAATFANWFPVANWAFPNAVLSSGLTLGQAAIGPVVTLLIISYGWRVSFYALAPVGLIAAAWWWWYGRDTPAQHRAVSAAELALISAGRPPAQSSEEVHAAWLKVLLNRNVLLIAGSYFCMNYVFYFFSQWMFTYLVQARGFTLLQSGFLYALPFIVGAVLATVGGLTCDFLCLRIGPRWGCRLPGVVGMVMVAILLLAGIEAANPYVAVGLLSLCFGFTQFTEGAYWQASTFAAGPHTATATGVLNTGGNLPGFLAPLIGLMVDRLGWFPTFAVGSLFALAGAGLWLLVRVGPDKKP
jgi:ACS family glucarate transporter-like MFS transporter